MARKTIHKRPAVAPAKRIVPTLVVIGELRDELKRIDNHLASIDSLLAAMGDEDDWGHALGCAVSAVRSETAHVCDRLGQLTVDAHGHVIGIEEGGGR